MEQDAQTIERKLGHFRILYAANISFRNEGSLKTYSDIQKLKELGGLLYKTCERKSFRWKNDTRCKSEFIQVTDEHWSGNGKDKYVEYFFLLFKT